LLIYAQQASAAQSRRARALQVVSGGANKMRVSFPARDTERTSTRLPAPAVFGIASCRKVGAQPANIGCSAAS